MRLRCCASGFPVPNYQWQKDNEELENQRQPELKINTFSLDDEGYYICQVSHVRANGEYCEISSNEIEVRALEEPPKIVCQPRSLRVCVGEKFVLRCVAESYPPPTYAWYRRKNEEIPGATTSEVEILSTKVTDGGTFRCYVSNSVDGVWSEEVEVLVVQPTYIHPTEPLIAHGKVALLIANYSYKNHSTLKMPSHDVHTFAEMLESLNFHVIALQNLSLIEMVVALRVFCGILDKGCYGVFYFAGHGFEFRSSGCMLPVDAPPSRRYRQRDCLREEEVLSAMCRRQPQLCLVLLDMCLTNPDSESNPNIHKENAPSISYKSNRNVVVGYATSSSGEAFERCNDKNGFFMKHLCKYLKDKEGIEDILRKVKCDMQQEEKRAADLQMPSHKSNITKPFSLADPFKENYEMHTKMARLNMSPWSIKAEFPKAGIAVHLNFEVYYDCFLNGMTILLDNFDDKIWEINVKCISCTAVRVTAELGNDSIFYLENLQKVKGLLVLQLDLRCRIVDVNVDLCVIEVELPLLCRILRLDLCDNSRTLPQPLMRTTSWHPEHRDRVEDEKKSSGSLSE